MAEDDGDVAAGGGAADYEACGGVGGEVGGVGSDLGEMWMLVRRRVLRIS